MAQTTLSGSNRGLIAFLLVVVLAVLAFAVIGMKDNRSTGERLGDAVDALPHGVDDASEQLRDRTAGERLGDAVRETSDNVKSE